MENPIKMDDLGVPLFLEIPKGSSFTPAFLVTHSFGHPHLCTWGVSQHEPGDNMSHIRKVGMEPIKVGHEPIVINGVMGCLFCGVY